MARIPSPRLVALVLLLAAASAGASDPPPADELKKVARSFTTEFLDGRHDAAAERMSEVMRSAAGAERWEQLRRALVLQNGAVREIGEPWLEDTVQGFLRLRVPVRFEDEPLDFRFFLDASSLVSGFFIERHVEPPAAGRETELQFGPEGRTLPATLTLPSGNAPFPAVVLVHGSGPNDRDETIGPNKPFRDLAWGLAEHGVAVLRYDKRSLAHPGDLLTAGDGLTVHQEVIADARLALDLLRERTEIDASRIFLLGHSLGGSLLPRIASEEPRPAGLISLAGAVDLRPEKLVEQLRYITAHDEEVTAEERARLELVEQAVAEVRAALDGKGPDPTGLVLGAPVGYFRDLAAHDPAREAAALMLPILVLQGTRDYQVTLEEFEAWKRALADQPFACLVAYDGLDHLFRMGQGDSTPEDYRRPAPVDPRVVDDIARWIDDRSCPDAR